ncbi:hypothetical protein K435DRAFT_113449 [Dendrothele bispora CBS 962.96]|uniref:RNase H type-1 domain-containing protein n=1 Tax=Dendrothele bispora (strain CBS 962.96) TaxID=1314807 RepID=A0A4S8M161_DENBC|nr:hypothetical protein K435DRAFT_971733 [Dendrothele bispora CBS 962.96]THU95807.1 hypothetical protein K435DRAFT_113449 [Dendrothele bispora CBS 962.96]
MVTGALASTATDILDIHAGFLPMPLEIERQRHRAAVRLCTLPETHPLAQHITDAARKRRRKRHFSPLHDLMDRYGLHPRVMEKKKVVRFPVSWDPRIELVICEGINEACEAAVQDKADVQVFTDGSGFQGGVGASAVLYWDDQE